MDFETFCDTAELCDPMMVIRRQRLPEDWFDGADKVIVYEGNCYITDQGGGLFHLHIGNQEWVDYDLEKLEAILYKEWFVPEILGEEA